MCGQTVIPRFTVQFGEKKCSEYRGNSKSGTININLHIRLLFGGEKNELGISGKTVYRGTVNRGTTVPVYIGGSVRVGILAGHVTRPFVEVKTHVGSSSRAAVPGRKYAVQVLFKRKVIFF